MITETSTEELIKKIAIAREWAKKHFNADKAEDANLFLNLATGTVRGMSLATPSFFVEFPSPDIMLVSPSITGRPSGITIAYRLSFRQDDTMAWNCLNARFPLLEVL